jgi:hypothetical protein
LRLNVEAGETICAMPDAQQHIDCAAFISPVEAGAFRRELADLAPVPDTDIGPAIDEGQVLRRDEIRWRWPSAATCAATPALIAPS